MTDQVSCPCNSNSVYSDCCKPILDGNQRPVTAETLMRSRYSAYVGHDTDYLLKTWHSSTRPVNIDPATIPKWYGLQIVHTEAGGRTDNKGIVEFKATYLLQTKMRKLHEISRFVKENEQWFYVDGDILGDSPPVTSLKKVGRNERCPCGSGKKFKKCCGP